ncbi:hypothetical protein ACFQ5J_08130, partial [Lacticaseibacillus baoqingensis]
SRSNLTIVKPPDLDCCPNLGVHIIAVPFLVLLSCGNIVFGVDWVDRFASVAPFAVVAIKPICL